MTDIGIEPAATADWLDQRGMHGAATLIRRMAATEAALRTQLGTPSHPTQKVQDLEEQICTFTERLGAVGWITDSNERKLHRWAGAWWALVHHDRNPKDDHPYTGWYLDGPVGSGASGEWMAHRTKEAKEEADQFIKEHVAQDGGTQ
ncbi:hypothetical protein Sipo8835_37270 [Streptomyces ipomoeae]|uniref:Uncharacterized protein n=1 Tax=Streptomyces ipomoeae TaxID=103232 RepID=A0AAE9AX98_9ACTN|nr:hypothetical protein [Streptomyces ipomoeae]TQE21605.1 hypothetical protein Sipo8835_37270 [Streptomyces ipomoeae]